VDSLQLRWLGLPTVELKGRQVKLETRKGVALLAYLSTGGQRQQREVAATMLWPDGDQQRALASLRRTLSSLNTRLPGWMEADRETISLRQSGKLRIDVAEFGRLLERVRTHCSDGHELCDECQTALEKALSLYRGDFLEGLILGDAPQFDDWQFFQREELRRELGTALERLARAYASNSQWEPAIQAAQRWMGLDRFNEPACRMLMDLYARSAQRAAALRQYEDLKRLLQEQRDQVPEDETRRLHEKIRGPQGTGAASGQEQPSSAAPLLKTKLYVPSPPAQRVARSRLVDGLRGVETHALTLISAPAGFGKTTLLAEWIAHTSLSVAWLSLDQGDNEANRFLAYLAEALEGVHEGVATRVRQNLKSPGLAAPRAILAQIIHSLGGLPQVTALVLDDYQFITEPAIHDLLQQMLDDVPPNLRLVIATRADPAVSLGRLRAHGHLLELRTRDLRFTSDEASTFLNEVMQLSLAPDDIAALEARTEGWVVGLQMAALSLQGQESAREFIQAFSGSHRYVLDYLLEEVLRRQPVHIQDFLMETSILDKLSGPLCDALMTDESKARGGRGQATLEHLERSNLFVVPLDNERQWYRYHHLFVDLLRSRLRQSSPGRAAHLHTRASDWHEQHGDFNEAVEHALQARDYERAAVLLDRSSRTSVVINLFAFENWIRQLPVDMIRRHPWIRISQSWIAIVKGKLDGIEEQLKEAEGCIQESDRHFGEVEADEIHGHVAMIRAYAAFFRGEPRTTIHLAKIALEMVQHSNAYLRSRILLQLGESHTVLGEMEEASRYLQQAIASSIEGGDISVATVAHFRLGSIELVLGHLNEAERLFRRSLQVLKDMGAEESHLRGKPEIGLGHVLRERGRLDEAKRWQSTGHKHSELQGQPYDYVWSFIFNSRLLAAEGNEEAALGLLSEAEPLFQASTIPASIHAALEYEQVRLWLRLGRPAEVERWIIESRLDPRGALSYPVEIKLMTLARALLGVGRTSEAVELLKRLSDAAAEAGRDGRLIEILILLAVALRRTERTPEALEALSSALKLAEPQGYQRIFLDEGEPVLDLLRQLDGSELAPRLQEYVGQLLNSTA
jgi:LuxR family maltose regulon positive regulatory protein